MNNLGDNMARKIKIEKEEVKKPEKVADVQEKSKSVKIEKVAKPEKKVVFSRKKNVEKGEVKQTRIRRFKAEYSTGLTNEQVEDRKAKGLTNFTPNTNVKTYKSIFIENIFTFFNLLCFAIFASLAIVGAWSNCIFMLVIVANIAIGIIQEIRAKRTIEKLSLLKSFVMESSKQLMLTKLF